MNHPQTIERIRGQAQTLCAARAPWRQIVAELQRATRGACTLGCIANESTVSVFDRTGGTRSVKTAGWSFLFAVARCPAVGCGRTSVHLHGRGRYCSASCRSRAAKARVRAALPAPEAVEEASQGAHLCDARVGTPAPLPPTTPAGVYATVRIPDELAEEVAAAAPGSRMRIAVVGVELLCGRDPDDGRELVYECVAAGEPAEAPA